MRKLAIFPNDAGEVVVAVKEDGDEAFATICALEMKKFNTLFLQAALEATKIRVMQIEGTGV